MVDVDIYQLDISRDLRYPFLVSLIYICWNLVINFRSYGEVLGQLVPVSIISRQFANKERQPSKFEYTWDRFFNVGLRGCVLPVSSKLAACSVKAVTGDAVPG